jgi:DNA-binding transcriptional MerR regulator
MADGGGFTETTGTIARKADCDAGTVRRYEGEGLIECIRLPGGQRLFHASTVERVRELLAERRRVHRTQAPEAA